MWFHVFLQEAQTYAVRLIVPFNLIEWVNRMFASFITNL
jgi:hypothetical protein